VRGPLRLGRRVLEPRQLLVVADAGPRSVERVHAAVAEGADVVEVAARPGGVDEREEIRQTVPFIAAIRDAYSELVIGVDTGRREVAREACAAGADLLIDSGDAGLAEVAVRHDAGLICSLAMAELAVAAGMDRARIIVDLAHGAGGNTIFSPEATRRLEELTALGWAVLVSVPGDDLATVAVCAWLGARVFRVRRVRETRRVLSMVSAIRGDIPPASAVRGLA
jgi:dihydropteroate synthase